jgi:hypothetical protein
MNAGILNAREEVRIYRESGLLETMYKQRDLRYISPETTPDALVYKVLEVGIWTPSGGNQPRWQFSIIKQTPSNTVRGFWCEPAAFIENENGHCPLKATAQT